MQTSDFVFLKNGEILKTFNIIFFIFKQKEHEFARIAIAVKKNLIMPDTLIIEGFFKGIFFQSFEENHHQWLVFIAASNIKIVENEQYILYCNPYTHNISKIIDEDKNKILITNVICFKENICSKTPKFLICNKNNHQEHVSEKLYFKEIQIVNKETNDKIFARQCISFINKLKTIGSVNIINKETNKINLIIRYINKKNIYYSLKKIIENKNVNSFGEEKISANYTNEEIQQKLIRQSQNIIANFTISLNISLKIGNIIQYRLKNYQIISTEHQIDSKNRISNIKAIIYFETFERQQLIFINKEIGQLIPHKSNLDFFLINTKGLIDFNNNIVILQSNELSSILIKPVHNKFYCDVVENFEFK